MAQTGEEANFVTKPALKMKKPTGKPIGGESKMVEVRRLWTNFSLHPQNCEFFKSLKVGLSIISKNSLRDS